MLVRGVKVKAAGAKHAIPQKRSVHGYNEFIVGVQGSNKFARSTDLVRLGNVGFVEHDYIGELDPIDEQVDNGSLIVVAETFLSIF